MASFHVSAYFTVHRPYFHMFPLDINISFRPVLIKDQGHNSCWTQHPGPHIEIPVACETIGVSLRFNTTCCCVLLVDHQHLLHQSQGSYSDGVICSLQIGMIDI